MAITGDELTDEAPVGQTIASVTRRKTPTRVPASRYTSPEWAALEDERLWPSAWQIACSLDHVANPGDYFEYQVGRYSVVIVRGDDGELRAFQNVCRHRGNLLCSGSGDGLTELRCQYHRWTWNLAGELREVPSRKGFGALRNDDFPLFPVQVGTWGPLVFVNLDAHAVPLDDFLEGVPADIAWAGIDDFRCTFNIQLPIPCNWKTLIDGFSETYHVQGIHREMLPMVDDVNSPQTIWTHHGKLEQPYGLASPRLRGGADDQTVWEHFITVMGGRIGIDMKEHPGPAPEVPDGSTLRDVLAGMLRDVGAEKGLDFSPYSVEQLMNLQQYNLFPNATVLVFPDLFQVVKSRPGATPDDCFMDAITFERHPAGDTSPRTKPMEVTLPAEQADFGLVLNQDVANLQRAQHGLHQPGFTHLTLSGEECRIINLHLNLERYIGISPSEITGG
jgi:choline monooxygenase